jgi:hypothetical protein
VRRDATLWRRAHRKQKRALEPAARKDIDQAGLEVLAEEVPRTILVGRRNRRDRRPDRPARAEGCRGRLRTAALLRVLGLVRPWSPAGEYQLRTLLFAICRRHEIRSRCGVVRPFPHRNGIVAKSPFGIDVRHNDRAMEGVPVFP